MSADGARKLFVGGLAETVSEVDLKSVFENAGFVVQHLALPRDRESGKLRGFAFVTLGSEEEATRARAELQGTDCGGRPLSLREFSQEPPKRGPPGERPKRDNDATVFLGKLPFDATKEQIEQLFQAEGVGPVVRLALPTGPDGRPRGFGFATLSSAEQVELAVSRLNGATLMGRQIVVNPAQAKGGGGGPGGGRSPASGPSGDAPRRGGGRYSEPPAPSPDFEPFDPMSAPVFPPNEGKGGGRRREATKKERKEKRRGGGAGGGEGANYRSGGKKRRGGAGSWHRWEVDDD